MRSDAELKILALDIRAGRVFTSSQVFNRNNMELVFMPLIFMEEKQRKKLREKDVTMLFEYMDKAGPRAINGMPMFMSMQYLTREEQTRMAGFYEEAGEILESFIGGKDGKEEEKEEQKKV